MKSLTAKLAVMTVLAFVAGSGVAEDSYLYWMVQDATYSHNDESITFDYATVSIDGGQNYLSMYDGADDLGSYVGSYANNNDGIADSTYAYYAKIPGGSAYQSFLIELWTGSQAEHNKVGWTTASLVDAYILDTMGQVPHPLVVGSFVPEPSSALLLLLGMAGLGLKRRRV